ncbi:hypothetical protein [Pseudomonas sp. UBA2684]|uniref:hypothetical protein n=1 Tax=Pseudomonas sp. UBA2684 TaxID=1947311 RepID=UPI0025E53A06|nr:hypothetical protein [Pseudomonas sp. UBA2684]
MATQETPSASDQTLLDPTLQNYSKQQIAVANIWADHFRSQPQQWIIQRLGEA